ncbi:MULTISPECIES: 2Fe-2S iron-sulfur cluster-binding protein [Citricoccus]|uniref:2Fe-2S iron-sulfur cluster-binding protein n=1 Tax=Citricoccus TaxID=169133 RepID=UPI000255EE18|nr:2Fe-2S iron-sulfur cluster-binding protein [Citricoccus sp. CH26A]
MPKVTYTSADGDVSVLEGNAGDSVMEIAVRNGVPGIVADCGGSLACSTCHVYVREDDLGLLPPLEEMEDDMLDGTTSERRANSRLSCQLTLSAEDNLHVETPESQV